MKKIFSKDFVLILTVQTLYGFNFSGFFLLPKFLTLSLNASAYDIGNVTAAQGIALMAGYILIAFIPEGFQWKKLIMAGALMGSLSALGFLWVDSIGPFLYFLRFLQGFSFALLFTSGGTIISMIAPPEHLGRILGYSGLTMIITNGLSPFVFESLAALHGWRVLFIASAVFSFLAFIFSLFINVSSKDHNIYRDGKKDQSTLKESIIYIFLVLIISGAAFNILFTYYQPFALIKGITLLSPFFIGYMITSGGSRLLLGGFADKFGKIKIAMPSFFITGLSLIVIVFLDRNLSWLMVVSGSLLGLGHGLFFPSINAYILERVPLHSKGRFMAFFLGSFNIGFSFGVWGVGTIIKDIGYKKVFIFTAMLVLLGVVLLGLIGFKDKKKSRALNRDYV